MNVCMARVCHGRSAPPERAQDPSPADVFQDASTSAGDAALSPELPAGEGLHRNQPVIASRHRRQAGAPMGLRQSMGGRYLSSSSGSTSSAVWGIWGMVSVVVATGGVSTDA